MRATLKSITSPMQSQASTPRPQERLARPAWGSPTLIVHGGHPQGNLVPPSPSRAGGGRLGRYEVSRGHNALVPESPDGGRVKRALLGSGKESSAGGVGISADLSSPATGLGADVKDVNPGKPGTGRKTFQHESSSIFPKSHHGLVNCSCPVCRPFAMPSFPPAGVSKPAPELSARIGTPRSTARTVRNNDSRGVTATLLSTPCAVAWTDDHCLPIDDEFLGRKMKVGPVQTQFFSAESKRLDPKYQKTTTLQDDHAEPIRKRGTGEFAKGFSPHAVKMSISAAAAERNCGMRYEVSCFKRRACSAPPDQYVPGHDPGQQVEVSSPCRGVEASSNMADLLGGIDNDRGRMRAVSLARRTSEPHFQLLCDETTRLHRANSQEARLNSSRLRGSPMLLRWD